MAESESVPVKLMSFNANWLPMWRMDGCVYIVPKSKRYNCYLRIHKLQLPLPNRWCLPLLALINNLKALKKYLSKESETPALLYVAMKLILGVRQSISTQQHASKGFMHFTWLTQSLRHRHWKFCSWTMRGYWSHCPSPGNQNVYNNFDHNHSFTTAQSPLLVS